MEGAPSRAHGRRSIRRVLWLTVFTTGLLGWVVVGRALGDGGGIPPSTNDLPTISGTPAVGDVLTADPGTWSGDVPITYSYQWSDGATDSTDAVPAADVGQSLTVTVTATNDAGQASATSASFGPILPAAPAISVAPAINGTPQQGDTLTVSQGTWSNDPTGFSYAWEDCDSSGNNCGAPIPGATSSSYTLQPSDVGGTVMAVVTGSNDGGQTGADSGVVGPVLPAAPAISVTPAINGTPQQGDTLTVSQGTWNNDPTGFSYAWEDCDSSGNNCGAPIPGATSSSYTLQASDVGSTIVSVVTAVNSGGKTPATSTTVGPVLPAAPTNAKAPVVSGTVQQGHTLSVSEGTWNNGPTSFSYAWADCSTSSGTTCTPIAGATSSLYTPQASDVGEWLIAIVTASNAGGQLSVSSTAVGPVLPAAPVDTTAPGISGTAQQGDTLIAGSGVWANRPTGYSYAWEDCTSAGSGCSAIAGATSSTYTLQASDVGDYVSVTVTASNSGGHAAVTSAGLGPVLPPAPVNTQSPAITGTAEQGKTLSVSNGTWSNGPTKYGYRWEECNKSGSGCAGITGATSSSYALSAADVGSTIVCVVTATGLGGSTSTTTTKTAVVVASPIPVASQPTTTSLLVTPSAPVTNASVTLIATVTAGASSTALWGDVTLEDGGTPIGGCADMAAAPSGQSATVACSASFSASAAELSAVFTPIAGSVLKGSSSSLVTLTVAPDSSSTSLASSTSVNVGARTTYTATVTPPAQRPGPVEPTGSVEFLDDGEPIGSCASQPLTNGEASCALSYTSAGTHQITASYSGDANFLGSTSLMDQVSATPVPMVVLGTISSTMQWGFYYTPSYTIVHALIVTGVSEGTTVVVKCRGHGCPFASHTTALPTAKKCGRKAANMCFAAGSFNLTPAFAGRRLKVGAHITVNIMRPNWVGKSYTFSVRARRGPAIRIDCLAPGGSNSAVGC